MTEVLERFPCAVTSLFAIISDDAAMSRNRSIEFDDPAPWSTYTSSSRLLIERYIYKDIYLYIYRLLFPST